MSTSGEGRKVCVYIHARLRRRRNWTAGRVATTAPACSSMTDPYPRERPVRYAEAKLKYQVVEAKMTEKQDKRRYLRRRAPTGALSAGAALCSSARGTIQEDTTPAHRAERRA